MIYPLREPFLDNRNESLRRTSPPSLYDIAGAEPPELMVNFPSGGSYWFSAGADWDLYLPVFNGGTSGDPGNIVESW